MSRRTRILFSAILLLPLLLFGAVAFLLSDRGLNGEVRPRLEDFASKRLGGEVRLGRLELGSDRLVIEGLGLRKEGRWRIEVPRLEAGFTLAGLLDRRLRFLRLESPEAELAGGGEGGMPEAPPLTVDRLEIAGGRVAFRGAGRTWSVDALDAEGTVAQTSPFRLTARLGGEEGAPVEIRGRFAWGKIPTLALEGVRWEGRELLTGPLTVSLPEGGSAAAGGIALDRFDERQLARILDVLDVESPLPARTGFTLAHLQITFRQDGETLALQLQSAEGRVTVGGRGISFRDLRATGMREGEGWEGEGDLLLAGSAPLHFEGRYEGGTGMGKMTLSSSDPASLLQQLAGVEIPPVSGGVAVDAQVSAAAGELSVAARLRGTPGGKGKDIPDISLLSAELRGSKAGEKLSGDLRLRLKGRELLVARGTPGRVTAELRPTDGGELAPLLPANFRSPLLASAEGVSGKGEMTRTGKIWSGKGDLRGRRISSGKGVLEELRLSGNFSTGGDRLDFRKVSVSARLSGEGLPSARLSASGEGTVEGKGYRLGFDRLTAEGVEYLTPDGTAGFTGGRVAARGTISGRAGGAVRLDLTAEASAAEGLKGSFYADLKSLPATVSLRGTFDPHRERLLAESLRLKLEGIGTADLRGSVAPGELALEGEADLPDLGRAAGRLRSVAGDALPLLKEIAAGGRLRSELALSRGASGWRLRGTAFPREVDLRRPDKKIVLSGASGSVPFDLGSAAPPGAGERPGEVAIGRLVLGPAELQEKTVRLRSAPNRLSLSTLAFRLAGGTLEVAAPALELSEGLGLDADVSIRTADLGELSRALDLPHLSGTLSADLGRIRYRGGTLTTQGEMAVDVFGGRIRVRNLRLESLATSYPTYSADADFTGIDLQQLTRTLAFGEINGVADGYVRELRLFGKVPSRFEALLETRPKGTRNISVKALRNLTTISQGGIGAVLSRGVYRFIDFYRYRKIGLYCSLKNDVFILRGTARDADGRYLVDGGLLPPKINIVAPEHAISFKEMVKRLQRMERTDAKKAQGAEN